MTWQPPPVGATASRTRTFTAEEVELFAQISGDRNPLHFDADFAGRTRVGALVVHPELGVIGLAHNQREQLNDATAHAEIIAITQAGNALKSWRLDRCILYVTLAPCRCAPGRS